jgi:hypothetical protein
MFALQKNDFVSTRLIFESLIESNAVVISLDVGTFASQELD